MTDQPLGLARGLTNPAKCSVAQPGYATLLARSGLRLAQTISLGRVAEAMGHQLIEAQPV
jgi:hypothetical protein